MNENFFFAKGVLIVKSGGGGRGGGDLTNQAVLFSVFAVSIQGHLVILEARVACPGSTQFTGEV